MTDSNPFLSRDTLQGGIGTITEQLQILARTSGFSYLDLLSINEKNLHECDWTTPYMASLRRSAKVLYSLTLLMMVSLFVVPILDAEARWMTWTIVLGFVPPVFGFLVVWETSIADAIHRVIRASAIMFFGGWITLQASRDVTDLHAAFLSWILLILCISLLPTALGTVAFELYLSDEIKITGAKSQALKNLRTAVVFLAAHEAKHQCNAVSRAKSRDLKFTQRLRTGFTQTFKIRSFAKSLLANKTQQKGFL